MKAIRRWAKDVEEALWRADGLSTFLEHRGLRGEARESRLIAVISQFLPAMLRVGRGQVLDMSGGLSGQLDIIVARTDTFRLPVIDSGSDLYLREAVFSAMEVKSHLTSRSLAKAMRSLSSLHELEFMARVPDPRSEARQRSGAFVSREEVKALEALADVLSPSTYVYAFGSRGVSAFPNFCEMLLNAVMETQIKPRSLPSVIARPGAVAIRNDSVLISSEAFGDDFLYALRPEPYPLYWVLAHLAILISRTFGSPGIALAPMEYVTETHLDPLPEDWKLFKVQVAEEYK